VANVNLEVKMECGLPASVRYTWPGKDEAFACPVHANVIQHVARALGMHLQMIPLAPLDRVAHTCENVLSGEEVEARNGDG